MFIFFTQSCHFLKCKIYEPSSLPLTVHCHPGKTKRRALFCRSCIVHVRLCLKPVFFPELAVQCAACWIGMRTCWSAVGGTPSWAGTRYAHTWKSPCALSAVPETSESSKIWWKMLLWLFHCWSAPLQMGRSIFPVQVLQKLFWLGWFPSCDLCINNSAFLATKTLTLLTITFLLEVCPFL